MSEENHNTTNNQHPRRRGKCCGGGTNISADSSEDMIEIRTDANNVQRNSVIVRMNAPIHTNFHAIYKFILIGDSSVGKTSFVLKLVEGNFDKHTFASIGVDFRIKVVKLEDRIIKTQIYDTAGSERYKSITRSYYHNVQGVIFMYDVTSQNSFANLQNWIKEAKDFCPENTCFLLLGNKTDLKSKQISLETAQQFAKSINERTHCHQISLKGNTDLESIFVNFVALVEQTQLRIE